jgi:hypothetical protein
MKARGWAALAGLAAALASANAMADEDKDLDLIPSTVSGAPAAPPAPAAASPTPETPATVRAKIYAEDAFTAWSAARAIPVPYPSSTADWQNRTSLDAVVDWRPWRRLTLHLSDRVNAIEQSDLAISSRQTIRNDLREAYASWEPARNSYVEAGRINVRDGVALGFNPTDFFKTRTLVGQASLDPSVLRQNRLGTLMVRAQQIWNGGSASVAFAPKLADPSPVSGSDPLGLDPRFDATNAASRVLCTLSFDVADLSPQLLGYLEEYRSKVGVNLTRPIGDAVVAYAEWAGGPEQGLIARANGYGQTTGTLPRGAPVLPPAGTSRTFGNDLALGASWTIATKLTLNVEYHLHEGGFSRDDWRSWFDLGAAGAAAPLWYVRAYAQDQQEPVTRHQGFARLDWPDAIVRNLELSGFAFVDLLDGSVLTQAAASYYVSDAWTVAAYGTANLGAGRTERGSFPQAASGIVQVVHYL